MVWIRLLLSGVDQVVVVWCDQVVVVWCDQVVVE